MDFQLSDIARNIVKGRHDFMLIMQKEGLSPLQIAVASTEGIEDILTSRWGKCARLSSLSIISCAREAGICL